MSFVLRSHYFREDKVGRVSRRTVGKEQLITAGILSNPQRAAEKSFVIVLTRNRTADTGEHALNQYHSRPQKAQNSSGQPKPSTDHIPYGTVWCEHHHAPSCLFLVNSTPGAEAAVLLRRPNTGGGETTVDADGCRAEALPWKTREVESNTLTVKHLHPATNYMVSVGYPRSPKNTKYLLLLPPQKQSILL